MNWGSISQKTTIVIVTAVKISNLTTLMINCTYSVKLLHHFWLLHHQNQENMVLLMVIHQQSEPTGDDK
jgi:hypothetical protein